MVAEFERRGHEICPYDHAGLDVTDLRTVRAVIRFIKPDLVVNCAAYTEEIILR